MRVAITLMLSVALLSAACSRSTEPAFTEEIQSKASNESSGTASTTADTQPLASMRRARVQPMPGVLDTTYVTAEFFGAIAIHPRRLAQSDLLSGLPLDELLSDFVGNTGVDPRQVEQILFLLAPAKGDSHEMFMPAAVIRFAEPVEGRMLLSRMWGGVEQRTVSDVTYFRQVSDLPGTPAAYLPDNQTMVIGPEPMMLQMVTNPTDATPLAERMKATSTDAEIAGVVVTGLVRNQLRQFVEQALPQYASLPEDLEAASLLVRLENESLIDLNLEARDAESTTRLAPSAREAVQVIQGAYELMMRSALMDAIPVEIARAIEKPMDEAMQQIEVVEHTRHVRLAMKRPASMNNLPAALADAIARQRETALRTPTPAAAAAVELQ